MKKLWIITAAVVVVAGAGVAVVLTSSDKKSDSKSAVTTSMGHSVELGAVDACKVLTQSLATKVLDEGAAKGVNTPDTKSSDINVSTCTYTSKTDDSLESVRNMRTATLLVRSPLTQDGADSNHEPFHTLKEGAAEITGFGDMAYWDPELGQLNVLKDGSWYILSIGKTSVAEHSADETKALAQSLGLAVGR